MDRRYARAVTGDDPDGPEPESVNRRSAPRYDVTWAVDCRTPETFLYAAITNISALGIFVQTREPLAVGTRVTLRFTPRDQDEPFVLQGVVQWLNEETPRRATLNPGMGVRFVELSPDERERIVHVIHTIAYLREEP